MSFEVKFPLKIQTTARAIENFWQIFAEQEALINDVWSGDGSSEFDVAAFMGANFSKIHNDMAWEFGAGMTRAHRLTIAPEGQKDLEPLARWILEKAPSNLKFFDIEIYRQKSEWETFRQYFDGRMSWRSPEGIHFKLEKGKHNLFDLQFFTGPAHHDERVFQNCFLMAECLLGEETFRDWIGYVDVEELEAKGLVRKKVKFPDDARPVSELKSQVTQAIAQIKNQLPKAPFFEIAKNGNWQLLKMKNPEANDYIRMDDLFVMRVLEQGPGSSIYNGQNRFASTRFSTNGEIFVFVKMDGSAEDLNLEVFKDKSEIEDAISAALLGEGLGEVVGGGTGQRYSYIFLALADFENAVPVIRETLQKGRITKQCWIMFNDSHREQEWIGIWDDSPSPFLPDV